MSQIQTLQSNPSFRSAVTRWIVLLAIALPSIGCNSFGNARLVKELQSENERLLAEFRAQRDRAEELQNTNRLQADRLAESEKLLARLTQSPSASRLSSAPAYYGSSNMRSQLGAGGEGSLQGKTSPRSAETRRSGELDDSGLRWQPRVAPVE